MDQRQAALAHWAADQIKSKFALEVDAQIETVSGDASFRRYFRLNQQGQSWICVDAPPEKENSRVFVDIAQQWFAHGIPVPQVFAFDEAQGFMLLQDFGDQMLQPLLTADSVDALYKKTLSALVPIQAMPVEEASVGKRIPNYDAPMLNREMELFRDWLCQQHLGLNLSAADHAMLDSVFALLRDSALAQSQVVVHRDYHSRNIMVCDDDSVGIIDFQDAVKGPVTYDLVSLLKDCYIAWPHESVERWALWYRDLLIASKTMSAQQVEQISALSTPQFLQDFDWMGMQRHLKAAGIFARLSIRDGKHSYLEDVPRTCEYLLQAARQYPQFEQFSQWLEQTFMPALQQSETINAKSREMKEFN